MQRGLPLLSRLPAPVDKDRSSRGRAHLYEMVLAAEAIGDIPVRRRSARHVLAALHIAGIAAAVAAGVRADRGPGEGAAHGRRIVAAAAADLVAEDSADDRTGDRAAGVVLAHFLALDPATPLGWPYDGAYRGDRNLEHALLRTAPVFIHRRRHHRCRCLVIVLPARVGGANRRDAVVHAHRGQRFVASGAQQDAPPAEARVLAGLPAPAIHYRRGGTVVESVALEIAHGPGSRERTAAVAFAFVKRDLGRGVRGKHERRGAKKESGGR